MRISVSVYGAPVDLELFLLRRDFRLKYGESLLVSSGVVDLRNSLRQDVRLLVERILNLDDEPASLKTRCLKSLGRTGRQPTMMPIAISAKLGRRQQD